MDLSVLVPSRNEMFLKNTIEDILEHSEGDTEVITILDGEWAAPELDQHERVTVVYHPESRGQRAATNEAARISTAEFIMKADAHCSFDQGFDVKLMEEFEYDWTVVPRMYNLHAFDWKCNACENQTYQGPRPEKCEKCGKSEGFERVIVWEPRKNRRSDFARFDNTMRFRYWGAYGKRPEAQGDIADLMCHVGACWAMHRDRYWELGGSDEAHGSWGQMGVEISCKTWLSGGRQVVNKRTWFSHMFRTKQGPEWGFPYKQSGSQVNNARKYSRDLWMGNKWPQAVHDLDWLLERFKPVPTWHEKKAIVYYTDNRLDEKLMTACQEQLRKAAGDIPIIAVSLKGTGFGDQNIMLDEERGYLAMFKQILAGLEATDADVIFFAEHDVLYHPSHFDYIPEGEDKFWYNENVWKVRVEDGHALHYRCQQTSGLCAYRPLLLRHYQERVRRTEEKFAELGDSRDYRRFIRQQGFEPGTHGRAERVDDFKAKSWKSEHPNIDLRHEYNLTPSRWSQDEFRNKRYCKDWTEAEEVPGWGTMEDFL